MDRIGGRPRSQKRSFPLDSDFLSFPKTLGVRKKVCTFAVCLVSTELFCCFLFSHPLFIQVGSMFGRRGWEEIQSHILGSQCLPWDFQAGLDIFLFAWLSNNAVEEGDSYRSKHVPAHMLIKLSCFFVLRWGVHGAFNKGGTRRGEGRILKPSIERMLHWYVLTTDKAGWSVHEPALTFSTCTQDASSSPWPLSIPSFLPPGK